MAELELYDASISPQGAIHANPAYEPWDGDRKVGPARDRELLAASRRTLCGIAMPRPWEGEDYSKVASVIAAHPGLCATCRTILEARA